MTTKTKLWNATTSAGLVLLVLSVGCVPPVAGDAALSSNLDPAAAADGDPTAEDCVVGPDDAPRPAAINGWQLVFADDFDGAALSTPRACTDPGNGWMSDRSAGSQLNINRPERSYLSGTGQLVSSLVPTGLPAAYPDSFPFDSGTVLSSKAFSYGYFEARIAGPVERGFSSEFWFSNDSRGEGEFPQEIDVTEIWDGSPDTAKMTIWYQAGSQYWNKQLYRNLPADGRCGDYHTWGLLWLPDRVEWYLDGTMVFSVHDGEDSWKWVHWWRPENHPVRIPTGPLYLKLSVGVHGDPPLDADHTMTTEWVRVYQPVATDYAQLSDPGDCQGSCLCY